MSARLKATIDVNPAVIVEKATIIVRFGPFRVHLQPDTAYKLAHDLVDGLDRIRERS